MNRRIIAIMTDFSISDGYIGVMKAVIMSINPRVNIIDLAQQVSKFNVRKAAFILLSSYKYFPRDTIFLCVIDPGVGTKREGIILKTRNYYFVGPNNGLFSLVAREDGIEGIFELKNEEFFIKPVSKTFHGRDIFAPVSAYLSLGFSPNDFGPMMDTNRFISFDVREPIITDEYMEGDIFYVDDFGNCITNIPGKVLDRYEKNAVFWLIKDDKKYAIRLLETYGEAKKDEGLILIGSHGYVEVSVNQGSAANRFGLSEGDRIRIEIT